MIFGTFAIDFFRSKAKDAEAQAKNSTRAERDASLKVAAARAAESKAEDEISRAKALTAEAVKNVSRMQSRAAAAQRAAREEMSKAKDLEAGSARNVSRMKSRSDKEIAEAKRMFDAVAQKNVSQMEKIAAADVRVAQAAEQKAREAEQQSREDESVANQMETQVEKDRDKWYMVCAGLLVVFTLFALVGCRCYRSMRMSKDRKINQLMEVIAKQAEERVNNLKEWGKIVLEGKQQLGRDVEQGNPLQTPLMATDNR